MSNAINAAAGATHAPRAGLAVRILTVAAYLVRKIIMSKSATTATAAATTAVVWRVPSAESVATGEAARMLHAAAIASGEAGFYVRSSSLAWGRKHCRSLTSEDTGRVWTAAADPAARVSFTVAECRAARRALSAVGKHLPAGVSPEIAESVALAVAALASTGAKGCGVSSPRVTALVAAVNLKGLGSLKAEATAGKSAANKGRKSDAPAPVDADAPDAPITPASVTVNPEPVTVDPEPVSVTVDPDVLAEADAIDAVMKGIEFLSARGVSQETFDMIAKAVVAMNVTADA